MGSKYLVPVEVSKKRNILIGDIYEYKLYSDDNQKEYTYLKFLDVDGLIIGVHSPMPFKTIYAKAASQVKNTTLKAVDEIKSIAVNVSAIASDVKEEIKVDATSLAKATTKKATSVFDKVKSLVINKK